ncbi:hypothetical protein BACFIN_06237 [Bacteroides finegoldii DSM 17565]|nr:hypothetical protein BACFIN_06237 [Bacteroides finegoldii DSM 17565]
MGNFSFLLIQKVFRFGKLFFKLFFKSCVKLSVVLLVYIMMGYLLIFRFNCVEC